MLAFTLLLGFFAVLLWLADRDAPTYDEPLHFAAGMKAFFEGDTTVDPYHTPTLRVLGVALSVLAGFEPPINLLGAKSGDPVLLGSALFQAPSQIGLLVPRATISALVVVTMWALFRSLRELFGARTAVAAMALWATAPVLLAHAHLFTTDAVPSALVVLAFALHLRAIKHDHAPISAWLVLGLAIASKTTMLPFAVILAVVSIQHHLRRGRWTAVHLMAVGPLISLAVLWAPYFALKAGSPFGPPSDPGESILGQLLSAFPVLPTDVSTGLVSGISLSQPSAFLLGESYVGGRWYYFPIAIVLKTQLSILIAIGVAASLALNRRTPGLISHFVFPAIAYMSVLAGSNFNIGVRHALVVVLFLLTAVAVSLNAAGPRVQMIIGGLILLGAAETAMQFPNTISFSNAVAGGYPRAHEYLSDSNVDWGQDAERAVRLARAEADGEPAFAYFGTAPPANAEIVSLDRALDLVESGERTVLISYSRLSSAAAGPARPPDLAIGGSIALWLPTQDRL